VNVYNVITGILSEPPQCIQNVNMDSNISFRGIQLYGNDIKIEKR
jgi:hypothetical protein